MSARFATKSVDLTKNSPRGCPPGKRHQFERFMGRDKVEKALVQGELYQGRLRINAKKPVDAFVTCDALDSDVFVSIQHPARRAKEKKMHERGDPFFFCFFLCPLFILACTKTMLRIQSLRSCRGYASFTFVHVSLMHPSTSSLFLYFTLLPCFIIL
ncbi:hypothetical protein DM01DRAFT_1380262 [Hesseltinella vesiculosa]|uniref:Rrp44-like cold shock domain-containing protein n=1 Tax=Hesseltinella vesiculosa TaxID=101127 RepID=A0A1X2GTG6_9FUNG|nr:hypothetical protein DM01DRAFT_1380262 [Hesseltinella vesiculosa]